MQYFLKCNYALNGKITQAELKAMGPKAMYNFS